MTIETDVKCLHCGRVSWRVRCERERRWQSATQVWPHPLEPLPARPRCSHCGGPLYLDEDFRRVHVAATEWRASLRFAREEEGEDDGAVQPGRPRGRPPLGEVGPRERAA